MTRLYEYDLPLLARDLEPFNPEAHEKVKDYHRVEKLYSMATRQLDTYNPGEFASIASRMSGPDVRITGKPHILSYCIQLFAVDFVEDLLSLGVDPTDPGIALDMSKADPDAQEYYRSIINNRRKS